MVENLFVYGTLADPEVQEKLIGRICKKSPAVLKEYFKGRVEIEGKVYPAATAREGSSISGYILEVDKKEFDSLDEYETKAYERIKVKLDNNQNAWVYVVPLKIRCFIAIDFPDEVIKEVARIQEVLEGQKFTGKMTELENLHLTLKFLGEIDEKKVEDVKKKLKEIKFKEMELKLGGAGTFSYKGNPKIVWIKVEGKEIWDLQKKIDEKVKEEGFKLEEGFASHLTITRLKYVKDKKAYIDYIKNFGVKEIKFKINSFKFLKSELRPLGPVYTMIEEYKAD